MSKADAMDDIDNEIEKLIQAGDKLADYMYYFFRERDKPDSGIKSIPRIGMELAVEEWEYFRGNLEHLRGTPKIGGVQDE